MKKRKITEEEDPYLSFEFLYGAGEQCDDCEEISLLKTEVIFRTSNFKTIHTFNSFLCWRHLGELLEELERRYQLDKDSSLRQTHHLNLLEEKNLKKLLNDKKKISTTAWYFYPKDQVCYFPKCNARSFWGLKINLEIETETYAFFEISVCKNCLAKAIRRVQEAEDRWQIFHEKNQTSNPANVFFLQ